MAYSSLRVAGVIAAATIVLCFVWIDSARSQSPGTSASLVAVRPLAEASILLQERYGKVVTYEEPILTWSGELEEIPGKSGTKGYLYAKRQGFLMPSEAGQESDLALVLKETLSSYHQQTTGTRFQVLTSTWGYHIVPLQVHDSNGIFVPANSLLDAQIYIPDEVRSARGHLEAFGAAVTVATGIPFDISAFAFQPRGFDNAFRARPASFMWGTAPKRARDALIDLVTISATTFSWRLRCQAGRQPDAHACVLDLAPITVAITNANGQPDKRVLLFDRCGDCPPLSGVMPPTQPKQPNR
jgi:hypothetical protein